MMPIGGTTQSDGEDPVGNWTFQMMTAAIESDPVWQATKGDYYKLPKEKHPLPGVAFGWSVLGLTGYDFGFRTTQNFAAVQPEIFYWDPPNEKAGSSVTNRAKLYDAVDLVWRNRVGETHNINPYLGRIQARTLVMHITNDLWLNFKLAAEGRRPRARRRPDRRGKPGRALRRVLRSSTSARTIRNSSPSWMTSRPRPRAEVRRQELSRAGRGREHRSEQVVLEGLRDLSLPGQIRERQGQARQRPGRSATWTNMPAPTRIRKVLVIIHGKGAFGGHYGNVMQVCAAAAACA